MTIHLIIIPLISALIGYLTNVIAIKLLFWPHQSIKMPFFEIQGLLPKRQAEIAVSVGNLVEQELLSLTEVVDKVDTPEIHAKLILKFNALLKERIELALPRMIPDRFKKLITNNIEKVIYQEAPLIIQEIFESGREYITQEIKVSDIVEDKIKEFDLKQLEEMIRGIAATELRFIEILGGILGLIIGLVQVLIILFIPF